MIRRTDERYHFHPRRCAHRICGILSFLRRNLMRPYRMKWALSLLALGVFAPLPVHGACCYFSAKNTDILQPAQKVFITWDPTEKVETFTVQPKFEGNALDF